MVDKLFGALSLTRRAGKLAYGHDAVCQHVAEGSAACVLFAADAAERTKRNVTSLCEGLCPIIQLPHSQSQLAVLTGKPAAVLAVLDADLAVLCQKATPDEEEPV